MARFYRRPCLNTQYTLVLIVPRTISTIGSIVSIAVRFSTVYNCTFSMFVHHFGSRHGLNWINWPSLYEHRHKFSPPMNSRFVTSECQAQYWPCITIQTNYFNIISGYICLNYACMFPLLAVWKSVYLSAEDFFDFQKICLESFPVWFLSFCLLEEDPVKAHSWRSQPLHCKQANWKRSPPQLGSGLLLSRIGKEQGFPIRARIATGLCIIVEHHLLNQAGNPGFSCACWGKTQVSKIRGYTI